MVHERHNEALILREQTARTIYRPRIDAAIYRSSREKRGAEEDGEEKKSRDIVPRHCAPTAGLLKETVRMGEIKTEREREKERRKRRRENNVGHTGDEEDSEFFSVA